MFLKLFPFFLLISLTLQVYAADTPFEFEQAEQQQRYQKLIEEIRCLVCQNQSLADSHAGLAQDLRQEIYEMISAGKNNREIIDFLVNRYGDFVLFRPPVKSTTWLLWFAPFLFLIIAVVIVVYFVRGHVAAIPQELNAEERSKLSAVMDDVNKEGT